MKASKKKGFKYTVTPSVGESRKAVGRSNFKFLGKNRSYLKVENYQVSNLKMFNFIKEVSEF